MLLIDNGISKGGWRSNVAMIWQQLHRSLAEEESNHEPLLIKTKLNF